MPSNARRQTIAHLQRLAAAATATASVAMGEAACQKTPVAGQEPPTPDGASPDALAPITTAALEGQDAGHSAVTDLDATAESTLDSRAFMDAGHKAKDASVPPKPTGYRVVDPLPPPTRVPRPKGRP